MSSFKPIAGGILHQYAPSLVAFEHPAKSGKPHANMLLFVGGLGDGLTTVPYVRPLAEALDAIGWGLAEVLTRSSYTGWGTGKLERDNDDIVAAVKYFQSAAGGSKQKIVLQGHSTGSQNTMYYLTQQASKDKPVANRPKLAGAIIQASVSDREAYLLFNSQEVLTESLECAKALDSQSSVMPHKFCKTFFGAPISAYRWQALMSVRGDDDFFSSDLTAADFEGTFGSIAAHGRTGKFLVAYSGSDEFVPAFVDKSALVAKWQTATDADIWSKHSGIVKGASHNCGSTSEPGAEADLIQKISAFLIDIANP